MTSMERPHPSIQEVTLGALLHDIGKLYQRAATGRMPTKTYERAFDVLPTSREGRYTHWHALWTDAFFDWVEDQKLTWPKGVDPRNVRDLAVYHHKPLQAYPEAPERALTWIVTTADRLASGFERRPKDIDAEPDETGRNAFRRIPLGALMPGLSLGSGGRTNSGVQVAKKLDAETIMPLPKGDLTGDQVAAGYGGLWTDFKTGWCDLASRTQGDADAFEEGLLSLLEQTTWSVPSSTMDEPDVPLFDHSRAVAAFAAALHAHHEHFGDLTDENAIRDTTRPRMRFLVGDLSGLQKTLFRLSSESVKGVSKILRGRSFRFQMMTDAAVRRALKAFKMPMSAALQTAGGRFVLLLPELGEDEMRSTVDQLRIEFDEWLALNYCGDLGMGLSLSEPFAAQDLMRRPDEANAQSAVKRANTVRDKMRLAIEEAKLKQLQGPVVEAVVPYSYPEGVCPACDLRPATVGNPLRCNACDAEFLMGQRLPSASYISIRPESKDKASASDRIFGLDYRMPHGEWNIASSFLTGWRIGTTGNGPAAQRLGYAYVPHVLPADLESIKKLPDHEDTEEGDIKTFQAIAHGSVELVDGKRKGREMLALIKADVDNLGAIFAAGNGAKWSLARSATLSRMIDSFFSIRLPWILENEFPDCYTVFAGGDDLMLVAPWRQGFELAQRISTDFNDFTLQNPNVTISAGISLFDPRTPVSIAASEAELRLESAKEAGRNRISAIVETPFTWIEYSKALGLAENLNDFLHNKTMTTAFVYRLLSLDDARTRVENGNAATSDYAWRARLGYQLARTFSNRTRNQSQQNAFDTVLQLFGLDASMEGTSGITAVTRLAMTHAIYRNR